MLAPDRTTGFQEGSLNGIPLPAMIRPEVPLTDDELLAFSRRNRSYRIERTSQGELHIMTPVGGDGGRWEALVIRELGYWADEHGGVVFSSNAGFSLSDGSVLSPDAAWVSDERWNALSKEKRRSFPPICPDFLIEVLSATDSKSALRAKMDLWMLNGALLTWMIDPYEGTVSIYRAGQAVENLCSPKLCRGGRSCSWFSPDHPQALE